MNNEKKLVPKLRFPEFTHAWEQRKLGDLANSIKSYPLSRNVETEDKTNTKYIHYGDIHRGIANILNDISVLPNITGEYSELLSFGDLVVADASEDYYGVAAPCVINCIYEQNIVAGLHTIAIRPYKSHHLFLYYLLHSSGFKEHCKKVGTGTKVFAITSKNLLGFESFFPHYEEQQKIGAFFTVLDRYITIHQRKLENMQKLKAGLLQKMFPKNDQEFPEIRFPEFTYAWEQRKVEDLFKITRGYVLATTSTSDKLSDETPYPVFSSQTKNDGLMGYFNEYLYENAITWTTDGANAGTVNYRVGKFYCTNVCGVLIEDKIRPNKMIAEALNRVAKNYVSYVGNPKLMNNVMSKIILSLPTNNNEQQKISEFFTALDRYITIHQRK